MAHHWHTLDTGLAYLPSATELQYRAVDTGWTPATVRAAFDAAEGGTMLALADLVESMCADDRIDGVLATRTHGLLGLPLHFAGGTDEARDMLEKGLFDVEHSESELVKLLTWGIMAGVGLAQRVPLPRIAGHPQRYRLETWSPRWLSYNFANQSWRVTTKNDGLRTVVPGAGQWVLFTPYGTKRPWASGKWRACAFPWLLKHFSLEDRANHSEVMGTPVRKGMAPQGATEGQRTKFRSQLAALGRNGVLIMPDGWDYDVVEAKARTWEIYSESIDWCDRAITIVLAGQIVTTEGSQGFASGNVQDRILADFTRFDAKRLSSCLYEQSLKHWAFINYGNVAVAPQPLWNTERAANQTQQVQNYEVLGRAIKNLDEALKASGSRVDGNALASKFQIPIDVLPKQATPSAKLTLAPTDLAKTVRVDEARVSQGLPPIGDERGKLTIPELDALSKPAPAPIPGTPEPAAVVP